MSVCESVCMYACVNEVEGGMSVCVYDVLIWSLALLDSNLRREGAQGMSC